MSRVSRALKIWDDTVTSQYHPLPKPSHCMICILHQQLLIVITLDDMILILFTFLSHHLQQTYFKFDPAKSIVVAGTQKL